MGSSSTSINQATDNRLAVTDQAFGFSSSGSANNNTLAGHVLNINGGGSGLAKGGSGGGGNNVAVNILDGGVIDKAFDFAGFSLSAVLDSVISGQKTQAAAASYQVDSISEAIAQTAAQAQEATKAATEATASGQKKIIVALIGAGLIWYVWKGKKK